MLLLACWPPHAALIWYKRLLRSQIWRSCPSQNPTSPLTASQPGKLHVSHVLSDNRTDCKLCMKHVFCLDGTAGMICVLAIFHCLTEVFSCRGLSVLHDYSKSTGSHSTWRNKQEKEQQITDKIFTPLPDDCITLCSQFTQALCSQIILQYCQTAYAAAMLQHDLFWQPTRHIRAMWVCSRTYLGQSNIRVCLHRLGLIRAHRPPSAAGNADGAFHDDNDIETPVPAVSGVGVELASSGTETLEATQASSARVTDMGTDPIIAAHDAGRYMPLLPCMKIRHW